MRARSIADQSQLLAFASKYGVVGFLAESEALLKLRSLFDQLGGLDECFTSPEGGL